MSVNASNAYDEGLLPLSKINTKTLKDHDIDMSLSCFKYLVKIDKVPCEWHHVSKHFNKIYFYNLKEFSDSLKSDDNKLKLLLLEFENYKTLPKEKQKYYFKCWNLRKEEPYKWEWSITKRKGNSTIEIVRNASLELFEGMSKSKRQYEKLLKTETHKTKIRILNENIDCLTNIIKQIEEVNNYDNL